ncbi:MAG: hypothetical protein IPG97_04935 [Microthrixaceae bacterium]|nr:hypothetical protein [Microthrixaceae bacterium]
MRRDGIGLDHHRPDHFQRGDSTAAGLPDAGVAVCNAANIATTSSSVGSG